MIMEVHKETVSSLYFFKVGAEKDLDTTTNQCHLLDTTTNQCHLLSGNTVTMKVILSSCKNLLEKLVVLRKNVPY